MKNNFSPILRWRHLLVYRKPIYVPGYTPAWHHTWFKCLSVAFATLTFVAIITISSGIIRTLHSDTDYVTVYASPRSNSTVAESKYNSVCVNDMSHIEDLIECVGLTDEGMKIAEKTNPHYAPMETVAHECGVTSMAPDEAIFGCWNLLSGDENITILTAGDEKYHEFGELPEITLTHELLHSVYYHLPINEQQKIWGELSEQYPDVVAEIEELGYNYLDVDDELFSRIGSEKSDADSFTKSIYSIYLKRWEDGYTSPDTTNSEPTNTLTQSWTNKTNPNYKALPSCVVTKISDGDTFYVDCLSERIRLIGVDTPESTNKRQCYGQAASNYTGSNLLGKTVFLESDSAAGDTDIYGRPLRYVYLEDGTNWNMQPIEGGYGMLYIFSNQNFSYRSVFSEAEKLAREDSVGLWGNCSTSINKYGNYEVVN